MKNEKKYRERTNNLNYKRTKAVLICVRRLMRKLRPIYYVCEAPQRILRAYFRSECETLLALLMVAWEESGAERHSYSLAFSDING